MPYVITDACIDVKDKTCLDACPVDCIYEGGRTLYIQPDECIDCGLCETVCPVAAIHADDRLPEELKPWIAINAERAPNLPSITEKQEPLPGAEARKADLATVGPAPVLAAFDRANPPSAPAAEIRRVEREYFAQRVDQLQYPTLRLDGLPIGSGPLESAADHVVQRRMKRAGRRWSLAGGQAMLALRARLRSHRTLAA